MPSTAASKKKNKARKKTASLLIVAGIIFISVSLLIFLLVFYPVLLVELKYQTNKPSTDATITFSDRFLDKGEVMKPADEQFSIIIPKIGANVKVVPDVDPYNEKEYQWQLTKGVAHAKGTAYPGQSGNVFIFSHSAGNFYEANRYNAIFYLLSKLEKDDEIYLIHKKEKFKYLVREKRIVESDEIQYLTKSDSKQTVTLMTCWPAGTTLKRLIIKGEIVPSYPRD